MTEVKIIKGKYDGYKGIITSQHHGLKTLFSNKKWYNITIYNNGSKLTLPRDSFLTKSRIKS